MKGRFVILVGLISATAATAGAQCASAPIAARQACYASVDLVNYMTPQLATAIAGGSPTLAQSGALGGLGRFALTVRGTGVLDGAFPNIGDVPFRVDGAKQSYTTKDQIVPGVGVDASIEPSFANLSVKVDALLQHQDPTTKNPLEGQAGWNQYDRKGGRISGLYRPNDKFSALVAFDYAKRLSAGHAFDMAGS